jgi:hypothetical protein
MADFTKIHALNRKIKTLVQDIKRRTPNNPDVYRMAERVNTAIGISPVQFAEAVGEVLYFNKKDITEADEDSFLNRDFESEIAGSDHTAETIDIGTSLLPLVKEQWKSLNSEEKLEYIDIVQGALDDYIIYLASK